MDEDNVDSKITCTKITFLRKLDKFDFLIACVKYIHEHPRRQLHRLVCRDVGEVGQRGDNRFVLVVGEHPRAMGSQAGDVLCLLERREDGSAIFQLTVCENYELEKAIIEFGEGVKVLSPKSLVSRIHSRLKQALSLYEGSLLTAADIY